MKDKEQFVAIKIIEQSDLKKKERFLQVANNEIAFLSRCKSANIVQYKEFYTLQNKIAVVMELCEEKDLAKVISEKRESNSYFEEVEIKFYLR